MDTEKASIPRHLAIHLLGDNGDMEVLPAPDKLVLSTSRLPCGLPPILPSIDTVVQSHLEDIDKLPIFHVDAVQRVITGKPDVHSLYTHELCPLATELAVRRDMTTGKLLGFVEQVKDFSGGTSKTSTSLSRAPGLPEFGVKGSTSSFPFWPGGMDEPVADLLAKGHLDTSLFDCDYLKTPPGFKSGMHFERKPLYEGGSIKSTPAEISLVDILSMDSLVDLDTLNEKQPSSETEINLESIPRPIDTREDVKAKESDNFAIDTLPVLKISEIDMIKRQPDNKYKWAVIENVAEPVEDFHERIPDMAFKWEFELDTFQKKAVLHLEKRESVFVAAHTSAGKTVVAEYAIALAKKHMTRVIYTSPIKALSNQKFRDFKILFDDVGLITGDVVINDKAFCQIMTTEILRSMLYHGSDVLREVEWVIFDEVHYINDAERGVVWEEVFIMLPQHVNLIMLSATVPNTAEFAEWLGGIKKRKVYVISTLKRPVPLVYHLYTGSVGKSYDECFPIVSAAGAFDDSMYIKATNAKASRDAKSKTGAKGPRYVTHYAQEKNIYIGLLEYLKKKDLLPVVCFTLSRKRCREHAEMLESQDLTTAQEKWEINHFFRASIAKLKPEDRALHQVKSMNEQLKRGFGIHHSGILPILKEVIELLFQRGKVKVLFATETFAMGVNMPARTVVFDSTQKHDGKCFRDLLPSEFIQMAGRAGRRGLDSTGTVIMLCKGDVPDSISLRAMILGKPTKLQSQFKLTYSMILNLLRGGKLRVEDVMKRSFGESSNQKSCEMFQAQLIKSKERFSKLVKPDCSLCSIDLEKYCITLNKLKTMQPDVMGKVCVLALSSKVLTSGRVCTFNTAYHHNVPGVILTIDKENKLKVLLIGEKSDKNMRPWSKEIYYPVERIICVTAFSLHDIRIISNKVIKVDGSVVMKDWRKMDAMKCSPGQCIASAFNELCNFCESSKGILPPVGKSGMNFKDMELVEQYMTLQEMENSFETMTCISCPEFSRHFRQLSEILELQAQIEEYEFRMSEESLQLHEEYLARKKVLKNLGYIDEKDDVQLKGSVAREMSNHELLITELLMKNTLASRDPEEIAAYLSCMVFQQRINMKLEQIGISTSMLAKIEEIQNVIDEIEQEQLNCGISNYEIAHEYSFHLTQIVYEWARGTTFAKIMDNNPMLNVEEGIIVRSIQRLSELLKDVRSAANLVGDTVLAKKMEDASRMIKRDIVFAASLYTTQTVHTDEPPKEGGKREGGDIK